MKRLLVNDMLTAIPGTKTFWHDLQEWFDMDFVGGDYKTLADVEIPNDVSLIIRNCSYFKPLKFDREIRTISLLQDIFEKGEQQDIQSAVVMQSHATVFNSEFTRSKCPIWERQYVPDIFKIIPLPVDFDLFEPGNPMGLQQFLSLPDNCICWIGASQGAAGQVKGYDIFLSIVRQNPDLNFVAVFKDEIPASIPPNMRAFCRLPHEELVKVIGACRVGLCTSRIESQHLAGIEMGACGLPMVAPEVGTYWKRTGMPGILVSNQIPEAYVGRIRGILAIPSLEGFGPNNPQTIRSYWQKEFSKPVIREKWEQLIKEVEGNDSETP